MTTPLKNLAIALDASLSMREPIIGVGRRIEVARKIVAKIIEKAYYAMGPYRLHLYVFPPSYAADIIPVEKITTRFVTTRYVVDAIKANLETIETRPTTPLFTALKTIVEEIPRKTPIIVVTDGTTITDMVKERIVREDIKKAIEEKELKLTLILLTLITPPKLLEFATTVNARIENLTPVTLQVETLLDENITRIIQDITR